MSEKMLVTQALDERDLLVKKIADKIAKASFVDTIKPNEDKVFAKRIDKEEYAAQEILNIICEERKVALEDIQLRQIIELGSQPWRKYISCEELQVCKDMSSFVKLMKQVCYVENDL